MELWVVWVILIVVFRVIAANRTQEARKKQIRERAMAGHAKAQKQSATQETKPTREDSGGFFDELRKAWEEAKLEIEQEERAHQDKKEQKPKKKQKSAWKSGATAAAQTTTDHVSEAEAQDAFRTKRARERRQVEREPAVYTTQSRRKPAEEAPLARVMNAFEDPSVQAIVLADILGPPKGRR